MLAPLERVLITNFVIFGIHINGVLSVYLPNDVRWTLQRRFSNGGITAVKRSIIENFERWSESDINVAVTGNSGVGKSSFINSIRGLAPDDMGAAQVGVVETTTQISSYVHPADRRMILWDLPGVGTPTFPRHTYLDKISADRYDYFVIISSERFTENDLWLAENFKKMGKSFYFVRSKVCQGIENDKRSHPKRHNRETVLAAIRRNVEQNLDSSFGRHKRVYLIDNYDTSHYDFSILSERLKADATQLKKESLKQTLINYSRKLIRDKENELKDRISAIAIASGLAGAMPVPGLDVAVDMFALLEEAMHYRKEYGIDDDALRQCSFAYGMSKDMFTRYVGLKSNLIEYTISGLFTYFAKIGLTQAASYATSNIMKYVFPIFGNIASGITSYTFTTACLNNLLEMMTDDALKINHYDLPY